MAVLFWQLPACSKPKPYFLHTHMWSGARQPSPAAQQLHDLWDLPPSPKESGAAAQVQSQAQPAPANSCSSSSAASRPIGQGPSGASSRARHALSTARCRPPATAAHMARCVRAGDGGRVGGVYACVRRRRGRVHVIHVVHVAKHSETWVPSERAC
jgi:hypothetical protein